MCVCVSVCVRVLYVLGKVHVYSVTQKSRPYIRTNIFTSSSPSNISVGWLVGWVSWHINPCRPI